jgi:hypothetical protein
MFANESGPLWPASTTPRPPDEEERCVLRLPRWFALPPDVEPSDVRVERRDGELVLLVRRRAR